MYHQNVHLKPMILLTIVTPVNLIKKEKKNFRVSNICMFSTHFEIMTNNKKRLSYIKNTELKSDQW